MQTLWLDLRYGARMFRKQPGFALAAALTLALGMTRLHAFACFAGSNRSF
jgi:hypothetical protein